MSLSNAAGEGGAAVLFCSFCTSQQGRARHRVIPAGSFRWPRQDTLWISPLQATPSTSAPGCTNSLACVSYPRAHPPPHPTAQSETWPPVPGLMWGWEQSGLSLIYDVRGKKTVQGGLQGLPSIPSSTSCLPPLAERMGLPLDGSRWRVHVCEKGREGVSQLSHSVRISGWSKPLKNFKNLLNFYIFFFHN